jgi:polyhydroxybutyrate depolymerase
MLSHSKKSRNVPCFSVIVAAAWGCSGGSGVGSYDSSTNGGGTTGGVSSTSSGGASTTAEATATGGAVSTNAVTVNGGSQSAGGKAATSGAAVGGTVAAGGIAATGGGRASTGGKAATGGTVAAGGIAATGGGGKAATGGGGRASTGGKAATGGAMSNAAGAKSTGGSVGTGGATAVGSSNASGDSQSPGCGSSNTTSPCSKSGTKCTANVNSKDRTYYVQLPNGYDPSQPCPLIFQFHPWGGSAEGAMTMYQLNSKIPNAIYVSPQGLPAGDNGSPGWANSGGEDIAFTKAMLADVESKYCVDTRRIFSTGFSYGGMMSFAIGCEMSDVFRAIAPMSGSLYSDFNCKGTGPHIAMWGSHGLSDTTVPIADGRSARDKILAENHCGTTTSPIDPSPCVSYEGCDSGYPSTWCEFDGTHQIPSFASASIAAFFKQF